MISTSELYSIVKELGENIVITQTMGGVDSEINAVFSATTDRKTKYDLWGNLAIDNSNEIPSIEGAYFTRAIEPNAKYLIYAQEKNAGYSPYLSNIYCLKCTDKIILKRKIKSYDEWGNKVSNYQSFAENVDAYCVLQNKLDKFSSDGTFDESRYNIIIPSRFMLSRGDRIVKTGFVAGLEKLLEYEIESVETSLIEKTVVGNHLYGIAQYQARYISETTADIYSITTALTNCTANSNNLTRISDYNYVELTFVPSIGYEMPRNINVSNSEYVWDCVHGKLILFKATGNVTVTITAISEYQPPSLSGEYLTIAQS